MTPNHRASKSSAAITPNRTLIVDNGAYNIKAGFSSPDEDAASCQVIPNCMARDRNKRVYTGSQLSKCKEFGEMVFRRPVEKGYIVNWEAEKEIWDHEFFDAKAALHCDPKETTLILTEAPNAPPILQTNCDQIIFEEFQFSSYYRTIGASLNAYNDVQNVFGRPPRDPSLPILPAEILLLVDSGYSHTTVTPLLNGRPLQSAIRRLEIGGKQMTNQLKNLLSTRSYDMSDETYLTNQIKESCCYISQDFPSDLEKCWKGGLSDRRNLDEISKGIAVDYVMPNYNTKTEGFMRSHDPTAAGRLKVLASSKADQANAAEDILTLRNERFVVPELLFSPSDIGMKAPGIAEIVMQSLSVLPIGLWPGLLSNIMLVGGNANLSGFVIRLQAEIRKLSPSECIVRVAKPADPIVATWQGGANLAKNEELLKKLVVTKKEYDEYGHAWVAKQFNLRYGNFKA